MIKAALICLVLALIAAILGFGGMAGAFVGIAKFLFFVAVAVFLVFLVLGLAAGRKVV